MCDCEKGLVITDEMLEMANIPAGAALIVDYRDGAIVIIEDDKDYDISEDTYLLAEYFGISRARTRAIFRKFVLKR